MSKRALWASSGKRYETYSISAHLALLFGFPVLASALLPPPYSTVNALVLCHLTYLGVLSASVILYRLSPWHPLARYPGPLGAKLSKWWMACISLSGYEHLYIYRLHEKYGDVVRFGETALARVNGLGSSANMRTCWYDRPERALDPLCVCRGSYYGDCSWRTQGPSYVSPLSLSSHFRTFSRTRV